ncbi:hypothetical protein Pmani_015666, partial [Petrolisthes manimaculis]
PQLRISSSIRVVSQEGDEEDAGVVSPLPEVQEYEDLPEDELFELLARQLETQNTTSAKRQRAEKELTKAAADEEELVPEEASPPPKRRSQKGHQREAVTEETVSATLQTLEQVEVSTKQSAEQHQQQQGLIITTTTTPQPPQPPAPPGTLSQAQELKVRLSCSCCLEERPCEAPQVDDFWKTRDTTSPGVKLQTCDTTEEEPTQEREGSATPPREEDDLHQEWEDIWAGRDSPPTHRVQEEEKTEEVQETYLVQEEDDEAQIEQWFTSEKTETHIKVSQSLVQEEHIWESSSENRQVLEETKCHIEEVADEAVIEKWFEEDMRGIQDVPDPETSAQLYDSDQSPPPKRRRGIQETRAISSVDTADESIDKTQEYAVEADVIPVFPAEVQRNIDLPSDVEDSPRYTTTETPLVILEKEVTEPLEEVKEEIPEPHGTPHEKFSDVPVEVEEFDFWGSHDASPSLEPKPAETDENIVSPPIQTLLESEVLEHPVKVEHDSQFPMEGSKELTESPHEITEEESHELSATLKDEKVSKPFLYTAVDSKEEANDCPAAPEVEFDFWGEKASSPPLKKQSTGVTDLTLLAEEREYDTYEVAKKEGTEHYEDIDEPPFKEQGVATEMVLEYKEINSQQVEFKKPASEHSVEIREERVSPPVKEDSGNSKSLMYGNEEASQPSEHSEEKTIYNLDEITNETIKEEFDFWSTQESEDITTKVVPSSVTEEQLLLDIQPTQEEVFDVLPREAAEDVRDEDEALLDTSSETQGATVTSRSMMEMDDIGPEADTIEVSRVSEDVSELFEKLARETDDTHVSGNIPKDLWTVLDKSQASQEELISTDSQMEVEDKREVVATHFFEDETQNTDLSFVEVIPRPCDTDTTPQHTENTETTEKDNGKETLENPIVVEISDPPGKYEEAFDASVSATDVKEGKFEAALDGQQQIIEPSPEGEDEFDFWGGKDSSPTLTPKPITDDSTEYKTEQNPESLVNIAKDKIPQVPSEDEDKTSERLAEFTETNGKEALEILQPESEQDVHEEEIDFWDTQDTSPPVRANVEPNIGKEFVDSPSDNVTTEVIQNTHTEEPDIDEEPIDSPSENVTTEIIKDTHTEEPDIGEESIDSPSENVTTEMIKDTHTEEPDIGEEPIDSPSDNVTTEMIKDTHTEEVQVVAEETSKLTEETEQEIDIWGDRETSPSFRSTRSIDTILPENVDSEIIIVDVEGTKVDTTIKPSVVVIEEAPKTLEQEDKLEQEVELEQEEQEEQVPEAPKQEQEEFDIWGSGDSSPPLRKRLDWKDEVTFISTEDISSLHQNESQELIETIITSEEVEVKAEKEIGISDEKDTVSSIQTETDLRKDEISYPTEVPGMEDFIKLPQEETEEMDFWCEREASPLVSRQQVQEETVDDKRLCYEDEAQVCDSSLGGVTPQSLPLNTDTAPQSADNTGTQQEGVEGIQPLVMSSW